MASLLASSTPLVSVTPDQDRTIPTSKRHREGLFLIPKNLLQIAIKDKNYKQLKAFNRINALTTCKSAEHGWLGASYSCMEILTVFTLILKIPNIILAKGHAAAGQYAILFADGKLTDNDLKNYKNGLNGLEAHADLMMDTGSLGQCLSSVAGMAVANRNETYVVILGDGEMQEGQIYEALMTIKKYKIKNLIAIVDLNEFQSDNRCNEIMPIHDLEMVVKGFGFNVIHVDGHSEEEILKAYSTIVADFDKDALYIIFAKTTKAGGSEFLKTSQHPVTKMECLPWHTKVPKWELYIEITNEQINKSESSEASELFKTHCSNYLTGKLKDLKNTHRPTYSSDQIGTGKAFGYYLTECINNPKTSYHKRLAIVDADLATSCGINGAVKHKMYFELGVAEQDAISFAAGLALSNQIPVVNTYSNFLKRGYENMFISIIENANIIFAGHYSGLCYHTDGKSHQSIDDLSVFSALHPRLLVIDPPCPSLAKKMLEGVIESGKPAYFRLRRTPVPSLFDYIDDAVKVRDGTWQQVFSPILLRPDSSNITTLKNIDRKDPQYQLWSKVAFVTIGTVATELAVNCCCNNAAFKGSQILVLTTLNDDDNDLSSDIWLNFFTQKALKYIIVIEDDVGALYKEVCSNYASLQGLSYLGKTMPTLKFLSKNVTDSGPSQRTLKSCLNQFNFTVDSVTSMFKSFLQRV